MSGNAPTKAPAAAADPPGAVAHFLRSGATYWGAMLVVGLFNLTFSLVAARGLGPVDYGSLAAIVALVNIFLFAVGAVTRTVTGVVARLDEHGASAWLLRRGTPWMAAAGLVATCLVGALAIPLAHLLQLDHPGWIWLAAAALAPGNAGAVTTGVLQGLRLFTLAGGANLAAAITKLGVLAALLRGGWGVTGGAIATLVEVVGVAAATGIFSLRTLARARPVAPPAAAYRGLLALPAALTVARLCFFNLDILVARHYLSAADAGLFAALGVTGRIIAYGTGALPPVIYPYLVRHKDAPGIAARCLLLGTAATIAAGCAALAAYYLAPDGLVRLLFGSAFAAIGPYVGWYGVAFLLYSVSYVLLHYLLAMETWWVWVYAIGGGLAEMAVLVGFHASIGQITIAEAIFFAALTVLTTIHSIVYIRRAAASASAARGPVPLPTPAGS